MNESRERRLRGRKEGRKEESVVDVNRSSYVTALDASSLPDTRSLGFSPGVGAGASRVSGKNSIFN